MESHQEAIAIGFYFVFYPSSGYTEISYGDMDTTIVFSYR